MKADLQIEKINKLKSLSNNLTESLNMHLKIINCLLVISILMILLAFYNHYNRAKEYFFARSVTGNTIEMLPLRQFNVSPRSLLNWAMVATTNAYTMDFKNYNTTLEKLAPFFTKIGFNNFKFSLEQSGRLQEIIEKKLIASAVVVDSPVIVSEGLNGIHYQWKIQLPIAVTLQGSSEDIFKQWLIVTILVKKVSNRELKQGIGIENMTSQSIPPMY